MVMKHTVSRGFIVRVNWRRKNTAAMCLKGGLNMVVVNYLLVGLLGAIVALGLYAAKWDMSPAGQARPAPAITVIG